MKAVVGIYCPLCQITPTARTLVITDRRLYVGSNRGLYASLNYGEEWEKLSGINGEIVMLEATGKQVIAGDVKGKVSISADFGNSWQVYDTGEDLPPIFEVAARPGRIYVATLAGIYKSVDQGLSWRQVAELPADKPIESLSALGANVFAGTRGGGVLQITDSALDWAPFSNKLTQLQVRNLLNVGDVLYAATNEGLLRSLDEGETWLPTNEAVDGVDIRSMVLFGDELFVGTEKGILVSSDTGDSWHPANNRLGDKNVQQILIVGGLLFVASQSGGIYVSQDRGLSWQSASRGLAAIITYRLFEIDDIVFAVTDAGLFRTDVKSMNWQKIGGSPETGNIDILSIRADLQLGIADGRLLTSTNGGDSWDLAAEQPGYSQAVVQTPTAIFLGTNDGIFRSTNKGKNWQHLGGPQEPPVFTHFGFEGNQVFAFGEQGVFVADVDDAKGGRAYFGYFVLLMLSILVLLGVRLHKQK